MMALSKGPGEHQGIESQGQLDGHPTPRMKQRISFTLGPPQLEHNAPAITVRVPSPHLYLHALMACPTVRLTKGGSQRRFPWPSTSALQRSWTISRKS